MRKLKLMTQMSVDGFIADAGDKTDWMIWNWGPDWRWDDELKNDFNAVHATVDSVLLSRKMAEEGFIDHWKTIGEENTKAHFNFARRITIADKIVFTKTLSKSVWKNTSLAKDDLVRDISVLKNQRGKDMIAYGGATFASSLIKADVIDEYYLLINPTVLGKGLSIFNEIAGARNFKSVNAKAYPCGMTVLIYS